MQGDEQQETTRNGLARVEFRQLQLTAAQRATGRSQQLSRSLPRRSARPRPAHPDDTARPQGNQRSTLPRYASGNIASFWNVLFIPYR